LVAPRDAAMTEEIGKYVAESDISQMTIHLYGLL
jgi:hypothetical protein